MLTDNKAIAAHELHSEFSFISWSRNLVLIFIHPCLPVRVLFPRGFQYCNWLHFLNLFVLYSWLITTLALSDIQIDLRRDNRSRLTRSGKKISFMDILLVSSPHHCWLSVHFTTLSIRKNRSKLKHLVLCSSPVWNGLHLHREKATPIEGWKKTEQKNECSLKISPWVLNKYYSFLLIRV